MYYYKDGTTSDVYNRKTLHRVDGPAVVGPHGERAWYIEGKRHRIDGPALIIDGIESWWIYGKCYSEEKFNEHPLVQEHAVYAR